MSANKEVILYFRDRLQAQGVNAALGYTVPDFARGDKGISCELWFTDGEAQMWQNTETPLEKKAMIECYVFRRITAEDVDGKWYDDVDDVMNILADNDPNRPKAGKIWWDNTIIMTDFASPLKRWNNSSEYSAGYLCARIDLEINYLALQ